MSETKQIGQLFISLTVCATAFLCRYFGLNTGGSLSAAYNSNRNKFDIVGKIIYLDRQSLTKCLVNATYPRISRETHIQEIESVRLHFQSIVQGGRQVRSDLREKNVHTHSARHTSFVNVAKNSRAILLRQTDGRVIETFVWFKKRIGAYMAYETDI